MRIRSLEVSARMHANRRLAVMLAAMLLAASSALADGLPGVASGTISIKMRRAAEPPATPVVQPAAASEPCNWWVHRDKCQGSIEGLPPEAPRAGTVITIDTSSNTAYLFKDGQMISKAPAATGSNKRLRHGLTQWWFRTPKGRHVVQNKIVDPIWTKPDWAFVEEGKPIPSPDSPSRKVKGKMGRFALDLGEGILIHGTDDPSSIGKNASHGCIRLGNKTLKTFYQSADVGTEVHIF